MMRCDVPLSTCILNGTVPRQNAETAMPVRPRVLYCTAGLASRELLEAVGALGDKTAPHADRPRHLADAVVALAVEAGLRGRHTAMRSSRVALYGARSPTTTGVRTGPGHDIPRISCPHLGRGAVARRRPRP